MWTIDKSDPAVDRWGFMSSCLDGGRITSTVNELTTCNQPYTPASTLGTAIAVSPSYQTGVASLAWGAAGKLSGRTFRLQWDTALNLMPSTVFVSGWNEFVAQAGTSPFADPNMLSMGLEFDAQGNKLFVDGLTPLLASVDPGKLAFADPV
jgi:hypothetical protein